MNIQFNNTMLSLYEPHKEKVDKVQFRTGSNYLYFYTSVDYGHTWTKLNIDNRFVTKIACSEDTRFVTIIGDKLMCSSIYGRNMRTIDNVYGGGDSIAMSKDGKHQIYTYMQNVYISDSYGLEWEWLIDAPKMKYMSMSDFGDYIIGDRKSVV